MATYWTYSTGNNTNTTTSISNNTKQGKRTVNETEVYVQISFLVILMLIIVVGNALVMTAYKLNRRLRTGTYTLLVSLAFCDFLVGSISVPMWINVTLNSWVVNSVWDTVFQAIDYLTALSSALHLTVICLERWLAISKPFLHQTFTSTQYYMTMAIVWLVALLVSSLVFIPDVKNYNKTYIIVLVIMGFILPLLMISLVNIYIFKVARKCIQDEPTGNAGSRFERRRKVQKERRTAKTLVIITALFFLELLPTYIMAILGGFCLQDCLYKLKWSDILRIMIIAKWMQYCNSGVNPFIYAFRDAEMRRTFKRISTSAMTFRPLSAVANFVSQSDHQIAINTVTIVRTANARNQ